MRLSIRHENRHRYANPARHVIQKLRLAPRNHEGQHVVHWRIDIDIDCRLKVTEDAFGNITHGFGCDGPHAEVLVTALGEVETFDTRGVVRGAAERFPPDLYLRATPLTQVDANSRSLAEHALAADTHRLGRLHALLRRVSEESSSRPPGDAAERVQRSLLTENAVHAFIAGARLMEIPARFVSGYRLPDDGANQEKMLGWAEAFVPDLGWVGFDPIQGVCPDERYVRVAVGLDALGAAPVRAAEANGAQGESKTRIVAVQLPGRA